MSGGLGGTGEAKAIFYPEKRTIKILALTTEPALDPDPREDDVVGLIDKLGIDAEFVVVQIDEESSPQRIGYIALLVEKHKPDLVWMDYSVGDEDEIAIQFEELGTLLFEGGLRHSWNPQEKVSE